MTNLEWIRSLSAEELAKFLCDTGAENLSFCNEYCQESKSCSGECQYDDESAVWKEWLNRETKETAEEASDDHLDAGNVRQV